VCVSARIAAKSSLDPYLDPNSSSVLANLMVGTIDDGRGTICLARAWHTSERSQKEIVRRRLRLDCVSIPLHV
jgi:hypothetical protein